MQRYECRIKMSYCILSWKIYQLIFLLFGWKNNNFDKKEEHIPPNRMAYQSQSQMRQIINAFLILMAVHFAHGQTSSTNLLINGDFSQTALPINGSYQYFSNSITGWNCTNFCEINDCALMNAWYQQHGGYNANCTGKILDLISNFEQNATQSVNLQKGLYLLSLNYYYPPVFAQTKTFLIYFNQVLLFSFTPDVYSYYFPCYFEQVVEAVSGTNTLRLTNTRTAIHDTSGFTFNNARLVALDDQTYKIVSAALNNPVVSFTVSLPGSRILFGDVMSYFINFDRLQLYYYHNRNYSVYSNVLLGYINQMNSLKGTLISSIYSSLNPSANQDISDFFSALDYKLPYSSSVTKKNSNGSGFMLNNYTMLIYSIPGIIFVFFIGILAFYITRRSRVSKLVRKFCFFGIFLQMIFEGNIQQMTFYLFGEFLFFFSADAKHKIVNSFILLMGFLVLIFSVASLLLFKPTYKKMICYLIDEKKNNVLGVFCHAIDSGVICFLFGAIHQVSMQAPNLQIVLLLSLEVIWIIHKLYFVKIEIYRKISVEWIMVKTNFVRMLLIMTFYYYQHYAQERDLINDGIHLSLIGVFLFLWLVQLLVMCYHVVTSSIKFVRQVRMEKQERIINLTSDQSMQQKIIEIRERALVMKKKQNLCIVRSSILSNINAYKKVVKK